MWDDDSLLRPIIYLVAGIAGMANVIRLGFGVLTGWASSKWKPFLHHHRWRQCMIKQNISLVLLGLSPTVFSLLGTVEAWWLRWPIIIAAGIVLAGTIILGITIDRKEEKITRWKRVAVGMPANRRVGTPGGTESVIAVLGEPDFVSLPKTENWPVVWLYSYDEAGGVVELDMNGELTHFDHNFRSSKRLWRDADRISESKLWSKPFYMTIEEQSRAFVR